MSSSDATRRASSTAFSEQQPAFRLFSSASPRGHCCRVMPTTSWPCACNRAAATDESTPPDIATAILTSANLPKILQLPSRGEVWGEARELAITEARDRAL